MRLIDITRPLDPEDINKLPPERRANAATMVPEIEYIRPKVEGVTAMCGHFGCKPEDLPLGEGWGAERLHINTHMGTHLDELYVDGLVLDLRGKVKGGEGIALDALKAAIAANPGKITKGCALMLRTGQEDHPLGTPGFFNYPGMTREGTLFLASTGAKILGTDGLGWDRPFPVMKRVFAATGDRSQIWDGHFAGRDAEVFIIQQLHNLQALPTHGFKVGFFPLSLARCSAAPARAVAFVN